MTNPLAPWKPRRATKAAAAVVLPSNPAAMMFSVFRYVPNALHTVSAAAATV